MKRKFCFPKLLLILGSLLLAAASEALAPAQTASETGPAAVAQDFRLTDQNEKPFQLSQLRGNFVLLFFGYTTCPDACPTTLSKLSRIYKILGRDSRHLVTLFVSVDPARDTPAVLSKYLHYFRINSLGLTGSKDDIDVVVKQFGARYEIEQSDSAAGYHINHSTDLYLLNERGELVQRFGYGDSTRKISDVIAQAMNSFRSARH